MIDEVVIAVVALVGAVAVVGLGWFTLSLRRTRKFKERSEYGDLLVTRRGSTVQREPVASERR